MFNGLWCYRYLLWNLVSRDFKLKYRRSVLGVVWSVLNPLLMCLVYWAVFSSLMDMRGSGIDNFPVFLMCGQLLFNFFNEATSTSMSSVLGAASLLKKVYWPDCGCEHKTSAKDKLHEPFAAQKFEYFEKW